MGTTQRRLEAVEKLLQEPSFRKKRGLGNEVGYYVFDYPPKDEPVVREWVRWWQAKSNPAIDGYELAVFDLYDMMIGVLEKDDSLDWFLSLEDRYGIVEASDVASDFLKLTEKENIIVKHIVEQTSANSVVFIVGVGKCYPVIRSHKILNNLREVLDHSPVVMFFPGSYEQRRLVLFGSVKNDNYYWANRLVKD